MVKRRRTYLFLPLVILIMIMAMYAIPVYANPQHLAVITKKSSEWTPFIYSALIIGGTIISTLSYVSWRKYKAEYKSKRNSDKMVD